MSIGMDGEAACFSYLSLYLAALQRHKDVVELLRQHGGHE
jgi:hypothetical protein